VTHVLHHVDTRRGPLVVAGVALGLALAGATAGVSWEPAAIGLGLALAAIVGLAQTCSA